jgi:spermidine synthase
MIQFIVLLLFFFSGACGLIYEVAWMRMLRIVFGNTTFAVATILTSFMAGLALGSYFFGRFTDSHRYPLIVYGLQEVGIGVFALIYPFFLPVLTNAYIPLYQQLTDSFYVFTLLRFAICFFVLLIPTFLMGGTLPVIGKLFINTYRRVGWGIGSLYGINTLGGVAGCLCAGFILLSQWGVKEATYLAAALNLLIGACAFLLHRMYVRPELKATDREEPEAAQGDGDADRFSPAVLYTVLGIYFLSGFCSLAYEVLWTRILVFFLGSTVYAFTIMLTTFLCGISLGSFAFSVVADRFKFSITTLGFFEVLIGLLGAASLLQFGMLHGVIDKLLGASWESWVGAVFVGCFFVMFVPTFLMGMTFPLISKLYIKGLQAVGTGIGTLYSVNTVGCIVGSFAAGFIIIPLLGITKAVVLIAMINVTIGVVAVMIDPLTGQRSKWLAVTGGVLVAALTWGMVPFDKPAFLYRSSLKKLGRLLYSREGATATVTVHQSSVDPYTAQEVKTVYIDGVNVAGTSQMLRTTQKLQAHLPILLFKASAHRDPESVFIVGFGSGNSSYEVSLHEGVEVYCGELVPDLSKTAAYFVEMNHNIINNPRFHFLLGDARTTLLASTRNYDLIESDSIHPEINFDLYTEEYFRICRSKLAPNGMVSSWLPLFKLSDRDFRIILKTFQTVFPHASLWYAPVYANDHALLIGSLEPLQIDFMRLQKELADEEISTSLREVGLDDIFTLLSCFVMGEEDIARYVEGALSNTANHPYIAFFAPKSSRINRESLESICSLRSSVYPLLVNVGDDQEALQATIDRGFRSTQHVMQGIGRQWFGLYDVAIQEYRRALSINPADRNVENLLKQALHDDFILKGNSLKGRGDYEGAATMFKNALRENPRSLWGHNNLAAVYNTMEDYGGAIRESLAAIGIDDSCAIAHYNLAFAYGSTGLLDQCRESLEEALRLDPDMEAARDELKRLEKFLAQKR